ncbi:MAG: sodium:alanine symporter family protein [Planctomycetota bacterium]
METLESIVDFLDANVVNFGIEIGGEKLPLMVVLLLGTGVFLSLRLGLIQLRRLAHGFAVTSGKYDDPNEPGDVSHFQALTTALSATVGIGNIAGVALALHWGGPGAIFWMWVTAFLGMATKYAEVTLAQKYRQVDEKADEREGSVSGGPMYYIEHGLGAAGKPLAIFFAIMLGFTAFLTGNAIQANTVADTMQSTFGIEKWVSGLVTSVVVAAVILGGIKRIGKVTGVLAPLMAAFYVFGGLIIILLNVGEVPAAFMLILTEAFNPTAGVAGTGIGALLVTLMWGVKRGLFSNEAGQGSAPIAHAAAKTDEPVSEGVVALLEPFIDTIVICSMTALVILLTGVWNDRTPTQVTITGGDAVYLAVDTEGVLTPTKDKPESIRVDEGEPVYGDTDVRYGWHDVPVDAFYLDEEQTKPFSGVLLPAENVARGGDGTEYQTLYCPAVESGAPMTMWGFRRGLAPLGDWGHYIVLFSVLLFAISTAISWSYYGDRCANYLFGPRSVLPYKLLFVAAHFTGSILSLSVVWKMGDIALAVVIIPNLLALLILSGEVKTLTDSYFTRKPWRKDTEQ